MIFPIHVIEPHCRRALRIRIPQRLRGGAALVVVALILFGLGLSQSPALAQSDAGEGANPFTNEGDVANPRPPRKPAGMTIRLSKRECRQLIISHKPSADATYKPGVDVRGKPVAPADLASGYEWVAPDTIEFDLAFNPLGNTGLDADAFANTSASVGTVKYDILTGKLTLNGRPLTDPLLAVIESQCRAAGFLD